MFQNGSKWLRADFHLHTKADKEFTYTGNENDFVNDYVNKLMEKDIRIGVITNHNKFDLGEYKAISIKARKENIFILPGVELSVDDGANGVHTLIVFDPGDWLVNGNDYISQFITTNFAGKHNFENENGRSKFSLKETLEQLEEMKKNHFIVMAHVEQNSGFLIEFDGGRIQDFGNNPMFKNSVLGFQKVRTDKQKANLQIWFGDKIPCFVEGSDPKSMEEIGKGESFFLKIGDFNFEAVQFSLIAYKDRVSQTIPSISNSWIKSISFQGGLLNEKQVYFSPELNNLIGIRGSGKSSIMEILRYVLNIPFGSQSVDQEYKNDLIKHVLKSGGKAEVEIVNRSDKTYRVVRIYGQKEDIYKDDILQPEITLGAILEQPVYFGQEDLSNRDADFENDLINKLIGGKLNEIHEEIIAQKKEIQRIVNELKNLDNLSQLRKETETSRANAEHKLTIFKEKGIAEKLQQQTSFESDISCLQKHKEGIDAYIGDLESIIENYEPLINQTLASKTNTDIFEETNKYLKEIKTYFEEIRVFHKKSQIAVANFEEVTNKLLARKEELKDEFAKIKREINIPELNPDDFIKINREFEISKLKLIEVEKSEKKRTEIGNQLHEAVVCLDKLWHERFLYLQNEIEKINQGSKKLSIGIEYKGRKDKFLSKLQDVFKGSGITGTTYNKITGLYVDFIDIHKDEFRKLREVLTEAQLPDFKKRFEASLYDLLIYQIENRITIKFDGKPLKEHSLGQRASALILFLLSQKENDILIIDQPEDDLDNQTIYEDVISEIKRLKGQMQFIFATHNANIPVLGDSEMLIACQHVPETEIKIETGSIDCQNIQKKIIKIMEGGEEAFAIRKKVYKIWEDRKA